MLGYIPSVIYFYFIYTKEIKKKKDRKKKEVCDTLGGIVNITSFFFFIRKCNTGRKKETKKSSVRHVDSYPKYHFL